MRESEQLPEFVLTLYLKLGRIWLALCLLDDYWSCIVNMHVHRWSLSRRNSFTPTLLGEEYTVGMQCAIGGPDQRIILGNSSGKSPFHGFDTFHGRILTGWLDWSPSRSSSRRTEHPIPCWWVLILLDLYPTNPRLSPADLGFHLVPSVVMLVDILFLSPPWTITALPSMALSSCIAFGYWFWIEKCYSVNGWWVGRITIGHESLS